MKVKSLGKAVVAALIIVLGLVVSIMGISEKFDYYGNYTSYETYGGDAYTGMQQASADASNNAKNIGYMIEDFLNAAFTYGGILISLVGCYLLVSNLALAEKKEADLVKEAVGNSVSETKVSDEYL